MNRLIRILMIIMSATLLSACNTMQGLGKDIEKGGQAIGKAAK